MAGVQYGARTGTTRAAVPVAAARPVPKQQEDGQDLVRRLAEARTRLQELSDERARLSGELGAARKRCEELEKKSKDEFGCSAAELPAMAEQMRAEAEALTADAETRLGMREAEAPVEERG